MNEADNREGGFRPAGDDSARAPRRDEGAGGGRPPSDDSEYRSQDRSSEGGSRFVDGRGDDGAPRGNDGSGNDGSGNRRRRTRRRFRTGARGRGPGGGAQGGGGRSSGQGQGQGHGSHNNHSGGGGNRSRKGGNRRGRPGRAGGSPGGRRHASSQHDANVARVTAEPEYEHTGIIELMPDGFGFVRSKDNNYVASPNDPFVPQSLIRRYGIRDGLEMTVGVVPPKRPGQNPSAATITMLAGGLPEEFKELPAFKTLIPTDPDKKWNIADTEGADISLRVVDLLAPIGRGQRALIVAPPRTGKTILLQRLAQAFERNHPEVHLMMVLIDERPEEVTDMKRNVKGEVIASSYDIMSKGHVKLSEIVLERARRLVEQGQDVVLFLDSLTRLGRAYNAHVGNSGRTLSGGLDSRTMEKPREFFGSARCCEGGGSLTIIATALIETGSRMDQVIFEEFKGTGNMELVLTRELADRRVYPALDINKSGTRKEEKLRDPAELQQIWMLRRVLNQLKPIEGMELLIDRLQKTKSNAEFLGRFAANAARDT